MRSHRTLFEYTREKDPTRPVTFVCGRDYNVDRVVCYACHCFVQLAVPSARSSKLDISLLSFDLEAASKTQMHAPSAASLPFPSSALCLHDLQTFFADVVLINLYYAWYDDYGHLELIGDLLSNELQHWYDTRKKPIIVSEYGADSVIGLHVVGCHDV